MSREWSTAAEQKLARLYATTPLPRLAFLLKRSENAIKQHARKLGLQRRRYWTTAEIKILRRRYPNEPASAIAKDLSRKTTQVQAQANKLGLKKADGFASECTRQRWAEGCHENSRRPHYPKGHVPANKGKRRPGFAPGRMAETQFKKGEMHGAAQRNYVPIGTEKIDCYGYLVRKVTDDPTIYPAARWVAVHRLLWEEHLGPVPPGFRVIFKNGDKTDIRIDNLTIRTAAQMMARNTLHNYPKDIALAIQQRAVLNRAINRHLKENQQ